jgi:hypothetical protein
MGPPFGLPRNGRTTVNSHAAIERTLADRPPSKVNWDNSPYLPVKSAGKNAVGDFGEELTKDYYESRGLISEIINRGHDVLGGVEKTEVKTAFLGKQGGYWFNQIYYEDPDTGHRKDWDFLMFVFVSPTGIEMWKCPRLDNPEDHLGKNNGYHWKGSSPSKLDKSIWTKVWSEGSLT